MCTIYISSIEETKEKKYQTQHRAGLRLLSRALSDYNNISITPEELSADTQEGSHGKPFLKSYPDIHYNISHCDNMVACAIGSAPIGVDIEITKPFSELMLKKVLTSEEQAFLSAMSTDERSHQEWFFRFWTLKESRIKHSGLGLSMSLTDFSFSFDLNTEPYSVFCSEKELFFTQRILNDDYILSLCTSVPLGEPRIIYV